MHMLIRSLINACSVLFVKIDCVTFNSKRGSPTITTVWSQDFTGRPTTNIMIKRLVSATHSIAIAKLDE